MSRDVAGYLRYHNEHVEPTRSGEKTATLRYGHAGRLEQGDVAEFVDEHDQVFAIAEITTVDERTVGEIVDQELEGHREYDDVDELVDELSRYYGEQGFDETTALTVYSFRVVDVVPRVACYVRVSDPDQNPDRQIEDTAEWVENAYDDPVITRYVDVISGAIDTRGERYEAMWSAIEQGRHDLVVIDELSRLSRLGAGATHSFLEHALEHDTSVKDLEVGLHIDLDDTLVDRAVKQLIAGVMGDLARVEHKQKLRRINSGIRAAERAGKWVGRAPRGFYIDDDAGDTGILRVDTAEFLRTRRALERVVDGEPLSRVASDAGIPEASLRYLRDNRLELYFDGDPHAVYDDDRNADVVDGVLDDVRPLPDLDLDDAVDADSLDELVEQKVREALQNE